MREQEIKARLMQIDAELDALKSERAELTRTLAPMIADFQIGQRVTSNYLLGTFEVTSVQAYSWLNDKFRVKYQGRKVLKSGELGQNETELYGEIKLAEGDAK